MENLENVAGRKNLENESNVNGGIKEDLFSPPLFERIKYFLAEGCGYLLDVWRDGDYRSKASGRS